MRVLVVSDIHGNLAALESVFGAAKGQYDRVWCLGDVVGYGPRPNECVQMIREQASVCVMGNHDWAGLGRSGIDVDSFNPPARRAVLWTQDQLTSESRAYLDQLPVKPIHPPETENFIVTHASPRQPVWEYIQTPTTALENFACFSQQICLVGHTHKPAIYHWHLHQTSNTEHTSNHHKSQNGQVAVVDYLPPRAGEMLELDIPEGHRLIINPGSVGQPRDNDARAAFAILDLERMTWKYDRVSYPIELTQSQMRVVDLPKRLIDRLSFGW